MHVIIQLFAIVFVLSREVYSHRCHDCIKATQCPKALQLIKAHKRTAEMVELLENTSCGYDYSDITPVTKVCCSELWTKVLKEEDKRIENHTNLGLLPEECGIIRDNGMSQSKIADLYQFPWMALIYYKKENDTQFKCGGSIINNRYVLTAAHCAQGKNIPTGVRVGEYILDEENDCATGVCEKHQDIPIEEIVVHEKYHGYPNVFNNIALLRLAKDINFSHKNMGPICLPTTSELRHRILSNEEATLTGWGLSKLRTGSVLRKVNIPIHDAQFCTRLITRVYNRVKNAGYADINQLCAGSPTANSCDADGGAPLVLKANYNNIFRYVQYGIVSHGPIKCLSDYPAVYTDVTKYMGWILDHITR